MFVADFVLAKRFAVTIFAETPREFALLYAFGSYRRGWQYAEYAASQNNCLEQEGGAWKTVESLRGLSLSWSRYFINLISEKPSYRSSKQVGELLRRIRDAIGEEGGYAWPHFYISEDRHTLSPREADEVRRLFNYLQRVASRAELPPLLKREPTVATQGAGIVVQQVAKRILDTHPFTSTAMWLIEGVLKAVKLIPAARVWIEQREASIPAAIFKGRYGYRGLVPLDRDSYENPVTPRY